MDITRKHTVNKDDRTVGLSHCLLYWQEFPGIFSSSFFSYRSETFNYMEISVTIVKWKWKSLSPVQPCDPRTIQPMEFHQVRILEWVAFPFSRGSSLLRDWNWIDIKVKFVVFSYKKAASTCFSESFPMCCFSENKQFITINMSKRHITGWQI